MTDADARVAVIGAGSWGTALAVLATRAERRATLWARAPLAADIARRRENTRYLPGLMLPDAVSVTADLEAAVAGSAIVVFAVPSHAMRDVARVAAPWLGHAVPVSAAKGLEPGSLLRMTEVLTAELGERSAPVCALSGPNLAREIAASKAAAATIASADPVAAASVRTALMSPRFRLYTHDDVVGVEIGGALKNVVALAAGMSDGLDAGDNAKAALMTRGLAEIARLGVALGANPLTFAGLSGLGDLIATCASPLSRNNRAGRMLAEGLDLASIHARLGETAEGIATAPAALALGNRLGIDMPIATLVCAVLSGSIVPSEAVALLMEREPRTELGSP